MSCNVTVKSCVTQACELLIKWGSAFFGFFIPLSLKLVRSEKWQALLMLLQAQKTNTKVSFDDNDIMRAFKHCQNF